jgi:hypothetical protein
MVALGGTSYAALTLPRNSVGTLQLRNGAVTAAKVRRHSLVASNFAPGQIPPGPQGPQGAQGPQGPAGPSGAAAKWALVRPDGSIVEQSGGIALQAKPAAGQYILSFGSTVAGKLIIATGGYGNDSSDQRGETSAGPCGGGSDGIHCSASDNTSSVFIQTRDNAGVPADHSFYVAVLG